MFNITKKLSLALLLATSVYGLDLKELPNKDIQKFQNLPILKNANASILKAYDMGSLYIIKTSLGGKVQDIFLTKDTKHLIAGNVLDSNTGERVSLPTDISATLGKEAFTYGSGKDEYILFTDPECPYCKRFESYFPQIEKNVKIRIFFFPLNFHKNAKDISLYVMSQKTKEARESAFFNTTASSKEFKERNIPATELKKLETKLQEQLAIARDLGVRGTPTIYNKDGYKVQWPDLLRKYGVQLPRR